MSQPIGVVIEPDFGVANDSNGIASNGPDTQRIGGNEGGSYEPEIITGKPEYGADTVRIGGDSTASERTNRNGKPDGRTRAARAARNGGTGTAPASNTAQEVPRSLIDLAGILLDLHAMGANILGIKHLEIDKDEAKKLADAVKEVCKFHNVSFDPKKVAYFNLATALGGIYIPRFVAYNLERTSAPTAPKLGPVAVPRQTVPQPTRAEPAASNNGKNGFPTPSELFGNEPASDHVERSF